MARRARIEARLQRHEDMGVELFTANWFRHTTQHHAHQEYQLTLSVSGRGRFEYLGGRARIFAGCMAIFHPGEPHRMGSDEASAWSLRSMHIPRRWLEQRGAPLLQPAPLIADRDLYGAFDAVWNAADTRSSATLERALGELADVLAARPGLESICRPQSDLVERCLLHLESVDDRPVTMDELSDSLGATDAQIRRAVVAATGLPPLAWHLQRRIQHAKELLGRGKGIASTSLATGFADQAHFTRHFKRLVGVSPSRYAAGGRSAQGI